MIYRQSFKTTGKVTGNNKGFTIVEVLMALVIFSVGILGLTKLQVSSVKGNTSSRTYTEASTFGSSRIEAIIANEYDSAALNPGTGNDTQGIYTINWTVTADDPVPNVKRINVVVTWGNNKNFTADYYKAVTF